MRYLFALTAVLLITGCAAPAGSDGAGPGQPGSAPGSAVPGLSPSPGRTLPSGLPKTPSDTRRTDWIAGRITRGGDGPCYGLVTDDGKVYALYSREKVTLKEGDTVRVQVAPLLLKISCGEGTHMSAVRIERVG